MIGSDRKACHWHAITPAKGCPKAKHMCCIGSKPRGRDGPWLERPAGTPGDLVAAGYAQGIARGSKQAIQLC